MRILFEIKDVRDKVIVSHLCLISGHVQNFVMFLVCYFLKGCCRKHYSFIKKIYLNHTHKNSWVEHIFGFLVIWPFCQPHDIWKFFFSVINLWEIYEHIYSFQLRLRYFWNVDDDKKMRPAHLNWIIKWWRKKDSHGNLKKGTLMEMRLHHNSLRIVFFFFSFFYQILAKIPSYVPLNRTWSVQIIERGICFFLTVTQKCKFFY